MKKIFFGYRLRYTFIQSLLCIGIAGWGLIACKGRLKPEWIEQDSKVLAQLYCEAKLLRIQRFELADQIRFLEDSMALHRDEQHPVLSRQLDSLNTLIGPLSISTKVLADSIESTQKAWYTKKYQTPDQKKKLDQGFQKAITILCPD